MRETRKLTVVVMGMPTDLEVVPDAPLSFLADRARHETQHVDLKNGWEIREPDGTLLDPTQPVSVVAGTLLFMNPRAGVGGAMPSEERVPVEPPSVLIAMLDNIEDELRDCTAELDREPTLRNDLIALADRINHVVTSLDKSPAARIPLAAPTGETAWDEHRMGWSSAEAFARDVLAFGPNYSGDDAVRGLAAAYMARAARPTDESRAPEGGDAAKRTARIGTRGDWCFDCGREYGSEHGFPDLVVPHAVWNEHISPFKHEGGLLCPSCMVKRAHDAGLENVPAVFRSGPFAARAPATAGGSDANT